MIGCGENGWCVCGLKCSSETLKTGLTSLGCDSMVTVEYVVRTTSQDYQNEGDSKCRPPWDTNPHARLPFVEVFHQSTEVELRRSGLAHFIQKGQGPSFEDHTKACSAGTEQAIGCR